jgi:NADH-quinone oxidoreductase subunit N
MPPEIKPAHFLFMAPMLVLAVAGMILVLAEAFSRGRGRDFLMKLTVVGSVAAAVTAIYVFKAIGEHGEQTMMSGMLVADRFSMFFAVLFSAGAGLTAMFTHAHMKEHDWEVGEFYGVLLLATAGMVLLAMSADLVSVFIGIETMSIAVYVLAGLRRRSRRSSEAAMKYFLMGAFATAFLLYGIALVYGAAGSTNLAEIRSYVAENTSDPLIVIGVFILIVAFGFKVAAAPFHMWAPDVYEGAPTPVTGFMAALVKAAAFAGLLRVFGDAFGGDVLPFGRMGWAGILAVLAAVTMTIGNIAALRQENVKRMLAYSSIAHAGYIMVGVVALGLGAGGEARDAVLYYLAAYTVTTIGAFAVVAWIGSRDHERVLVDDWAGLGQQYPAAALAMTVFLLSLGGIPPTNGFFGKFVIFKSAMQAYDSQLLWLVVVGVINSMISIYYYLRIVTAMYFRDPLGDFKPIRSGAHVFVITVCALLVLQMGMMPGRWLAFAGG